jgi:hypothetical protein
MQDAQQQLLNAQSEAARVQKAKTMMDVETLRIGQRIEILNNISTQATLLAGSSIAFLSGEALETVDDEEHWSHAFGRVLYVLSGSLALVSALWVIVIASHLIALTRDASLRKNILKASRLLDKGMREVRGVHQFALGFLLLACGTGAVINMELVSSIIVAVVFTASALQVVMKQQARPYGRRLKLIKPACRAAQPPSSHAITTWPARFSRASFSVPLSICPCSFTRRSNWSRRWRPRARSMRSTMRSSSHCGPSTSGACCECGRCSPNSRERTSLTRSPGAGGSWEAINAPSSRCHRPRRSPPRRRSRAALETCLDVW